MAYTLTQEQADDVIRMLSFDGMVEDSEFIESVAGPFHHYFLEDGTIIKIGQDCQVQHQRLVEDPEEGLIPQDIGDVTSSGVDYGVVEIRLQGKTVGYIDFMTSERLMHATQEGRHGHDLRLLDINERLLDAMGK